jgi:hypothetical protein
METKADQLLASVVDPAMANNTGNPEWIRRLVLVSDPRLDEVSETAWYLAADPNQHDTIVRAYLAGVPRPYLEENSEFEHGDIGHKCRLDFGVGVVDYRGLYKNAGKSTGHAGGGRDVGNSSAPVRSSRARAASSRDHG